MYWFRAAWALDGDGETIEGAVEDNPSYPVPYLRVEAILALRLHLLIVVRCTRGHCLPGLTPLKHTCTRRHITTQRNSPHPRLHATSPCACWSTTGCRHSQNLLAAAAARERLQTELLKRLAIAEARPTPPLPSSSSRMPAETLATYDISPSQSFDGRHRRGAASSLEPPSPPHTGGGGSGGGLIFGGPTSGLQSGLPLQLEAQQDLLSRQLDLLRMQPTSTVRRDSLHSVDGVALLPGGGAGGPPISGACAPGLEPTPMRLPAAREVSAPGADPAATATATATRALPGSGNVSATEAGRGTQPVQSRPQASSSLQHPLRHPPRWSSHASQQDTVQRHADIVQRLSSLLSPQPHRQSQAHQSGSIGDLPRDSWRQ